MHNITTSKSQYSNLRGRIVVRWTSNLGNLAGASPNPAKGFPFSNQNEVVDFIFVAES